MDKNHLGRGQLAILIGIVLGGFALRLYRLGYQSIWYDEAVSLHLAARSLSALTAHTAGDIHPPLYYYLLHFWIRAAGSSELAAAFLSLIFGVLLIPLVYHLARRLYNPAVGLLAAGAVALSPYNIWYSQEIRMYTLGACLGLMTLHYLLKLWQGADLRPWVGYVLSAALGLYVLYYFAFLLIFINLYAVCWIAARRRPRKWIRKWILAQLAVVLLYLPWLPIALRQALDPPVPPWRAFTSLWTVVVESWSALALGQSVSPGAVWPVLLFIAVIYILGLLRRSPGSGLLLGYTFGPVALIYLASFWTPLFHVRYVFTYSPAFYILLAAGLAWLAERSRLLAVLGAAIVVVASGYSFYRFHFDSQYASDDYRAAVTRIAQGYRPGDAVLVNAGYVYPAFLYYYRGDDDIAWQGRLVDYAATGQEGLVILQTGSLGGDPGLGWGNPASDFYATGEEETAQALERVFAAHPRLWMLRAYDTVVDEGGFVRAWLDEHGLKFEDQVFSGESNIRVQGYLTHRAPFPTHTLDLSLDDELSLAGYGGELNSVAAGEALDLALYWNPRLAPKRDYHVVGGLFGPEGRLWAQVDEVPLGPLYGPARWAVGQVVRHPLRLTVPPGTPPGPYELKVGMYDPQTGQALEGHGQGPWVRIGAVEISRPPTPRGVPAMAYPAGANFAHQVELMGYNLSSLMVEPGGQLTVDLFWRALADNLEDYVVFIELLDDEGTLRAAAESRPVLGRYPTSGWRREEIVRDPHDLLVPAGTSAGQYRLIVGLYRAADRSRLRRRSWPGFFSGENYFTLATVAVQGRPALFEPPQNIQHPLETRLGQGVGLVGYDLSAAHLSPGQTLSLTLYWQALNPMDKSYKVFTHLIDEEGQIWGQQDKFPTPPTTGWQPGEYLVDTYRLLVRADAPPGRYTIEIGMYDEASGARLSAFDAEGEAMGDRVVLGEVWVSE